MNYISWHASCQCIASQLPDHLLVPDPVNTSAVTGQSVSFLSVEDAARTLQGEGVSHSGPSVLSCLFPQCDVQEYGRPSVSFSSTPKFPACGTSLQWMSFTLFQWTSPLSTGLQLHSLHPCKWEDPLPDPWVLGLSPRDAAILCTCYSYIL